MSKVIASIEVDFSNYYEFYPVALSVSTSKANKIVHTKLFSSDTNGTIEILLSRFNAWLSENTNIDWVNSKITLIYKIGGVFAPTTTIDIDYQDMKNLIYDNSEYPIKHRTEEDIQYYINQIIPIDWESTKELNTILLFIVDVYKTIVFPLPDEDK